MEFYGGLQRSVPEGQYTSTVYGFIAEGKYNEVPAVRPTLAWATAGAPNMYIVLWRQVIQILRHELSTFPKSRAALSLLGFCCYQAGLRAAAPLSY